MIKIIGMYNAEKLLNWVFIQRIIVSWTKMCYNYVKQEFVSSYLDNLSNMTSETM